MTAYGYIRKSVVHDPARMLSPEMQEDAIKRLAAANGDAEVVLLSDLDISGTRERSSRPGWDSLLRAVEDGDAHAVYAYSLSRFARSVAQLDYFFKLCALRDVPIRMAKDHIDTSSATGRLVSGMLAQLAEFEADIASERVKDAFRTKKAKDPGWSGPGQPAYGERPGEDVSVVIDAFRERGSYDGAAKLLNERAIPCRVRGAAWSGTVVRSIVQREAPDEVLPTAGRGAPAGKRSFRFSGLVRCSTCEAKGVRVGSKASTFLTGSYNKRHGDIRYACSRARTVPHARGWVNETKLLPVIKAEADRAALAVRRLQVGSAEDEARMAELGAERTRVKTMYRKGHMDEPEFDAAMAEIADAESKLTTRRLIKRITLPPDIEHDDAAKVNAYLRRLFTSVVVDMSQKAYRGPSRWVPTVEFGWRDPSMRSDDQDEDVSA